MSQTNARLQGSGLILPRGGTLGPINAGENGIIVDTDGTLKQVKADGTKIPADIMSYARGADLGDADATLQPFTDNASLYVLPPNTLTANRTITFGNTSAPGAGQNWLCTILRYDRTAFTLTIKKTDTTTIYTDPISPTSSRALMFFAANGVWAVSQAWIVPTP